MIFITSRSLKETLFRISKQPGSEIAAFHCGDNPGRNEPTTGEINFKNVFKYIYSRKYEGVICMEHGKSIKGKEGEIKLLEAYREADSFEV